MLYSTVPQNVLCGDDQPGRGSRIRFERDSDDRDHFALLEWSAPHRRRYVLGPACGHDVDGLSTCAGWACAHGNKKHGEQVRPVLPEEQIELIELIEREHVPALLAYVTRFAKDSAVAEDVVQETLVRAWRHRAALVADQGSLRGWLVTVARNVAIDNFRRTRTVDADVPDVPVGDHAVAVTERIALASALRRLRPHHREVLYRLYYEDRSVAQTAEGLGLAEGTVNALRRHALRALRRELCRDVEVA
ncbi:sigma-70 family RNA polymerase sigma factor [Promicromonospora sukumoe]|uniref:sigma-70 family RNA polymerase sigma factor n=1 Tax=Promicromonospora sukumoe TaxID=88382 RepID=UPI0037C78C01